ncbi:hypothetical protein KFL_003340100 [Klebsormidium nitens]|uniref:Uncharacterized protein n=1 Tax=Klebsormidium nitens TaxID=105231 RepID=A0A1Y1IEJ5_KLENI|nr:hypothetical protein KFL_003340100 [Klebsormidium nitens]|eukprot:GAQ87146.1 hypothetical protein KFL_003340100 [Klebsormidium nitens]
MASGHERKKVFPQGRERLTTDKKWLQSRSASGMLLAVFLAGLLSGPVLVLAQSIEASEGLSAVETQTVDFGTNVTQRQLLQERRNLLTYVCRITSTDKAFVGYACGSGTWSTRPYAACCLTQTFDVDTTSCLTARRFERADCTPNGLYTSPACCDVFASPPPPRSSSPFTPPSPRRPPPPPPRYVSPPTSRSSGSSSPDDDDSKNGNSSLFVAGGLAAAGGLVFMVCAGLLLCCLISNRTRELERGEKLLPASRGGAAPNQAFAREPIFFERELEPQGAPMHTHGQGPGYVPRAAPSPFPQARPYTGDVQPGTYVARPGTAVELPRG